MTKELEMDKVSKEEALVVAKPIEEGVIAAILEVNMERPQTQNIQRVLVGYESTGGDVNYPWDGAADSFSLLDCVKKLVQECQDRQRSYGQLEVVGPLLDG